MKGKFSCIIMLVYALYLCALYGGVFVESQSICTDRQRKACPTLFESVSSFPESDEDVEELCPKILTDLDCLQNFADKCGAHTIHNADNLPKYKAYLTDVCKDSTIRAGIVKELPCMKQALSASLNYPCQDISRAAMRKYLVENDPDYDDSYYSMQYYCFYLSVRLACVTAMLDDECGAGAKNVFLDAHLRTGYLEPTCDKDETDELLKLVDVLELDLPHKESIGSILRSHQGFNLI